jgi:hypothetical protein
MIRERPAARPQVGRRGRGRAPLPRHESDRGGIVTAEGKTVAVLTLTESDVRPVRGSEILHVQLATA